MSEPQRWRTGSVVPGAEPLSVDSGPLGVLLCHGFTGSPASMTPWGRHLADAGHSVRVPLLPGHGTRWQDLNRTRWQDWYGVVDQALTELRSRCDRVAVIGLSMGGCLALRLAQQRSADVDGLVLVNPAVAMKRWDLRLVPLLALAVPSIDGIGNDVRLQGADEIGYGRTPLRALASQLRLWADVRAHLDRVTAPILLFRSAEDHVVDATSRKLILAGVSSMTVQDVTLTESYHVATIDHDAALLRSETDAFLAAHVTEEVG